MDVSILMKITFINYRFIIFRICKRLEFRELRLDIVIVLLSSHPCDNREIGGVPGLKMCPLAPPPVQIKAPPPSLTIGLTNPNHLAAED